MTQVRDIMTRKVLTLAPKARLSDAAWGLKLTGFNGAPVKDAHGQLIGVLSKSDLADLERTHGALESAHVEDAMTPVLFATLETDSVQFAAARMVQTGSHRLVVIDDGGHLVGILTPMDVMKALIEGRLSPSDFAAQPQAQAQEPAQSPAQSAT